MHALRCSGSPLYNQEEAMTLGRFYPEIPGRRMHNYKIDDDDDK